MIGDPSGRSSERQFLDTEVLDHNRSSIGAQLGRFLDTGDAPNAARLVDNRSWTEELSVLDFLRDVGKHVTINTMLARDSVRSRMDRDTGISYTEFSYMLLQAHDFLVLHRERVATYRWRAQTSGGTSPRVLTWCDGLLQTSCMAGPHR